MVLKTTKTSALLLGVAAVAFGALAVPGIQAQSRIDPTLPEAPLSHRRVLLLFPGYQTVPDPDLPVPRLRPRQKFEMSIKKTLDPSFLIETAAFAGFSQGAGYGPNYGPGWSGYGERFGYNALNLASTNFFTTGLLPVLTHEDPRYFRKARGSIGSRVWWAMRSQAVGYTDSGKPTVNVSSMLGFGMATALANAYSPSSSLTLGNTAERLGVKFGIQFFLNLTREFGGVTKPESDQLHR